MGRGAILKKSAKPSKPGYILDEQIGFILRQVSQRHASIFARDIGINLTPTQWAALAKLNETGPCSQNLHFARLISDRAYIIERGRICFGGTMAELDARPDVRDAHLSL